jgi:hypothetical protein
MLNVASEGVAGQLMLTHTEMHHLHAHPQPGLAHLASAPARAGRGPSHILLLLHSTYSLHSTSLPKMVKASHDSETRLLRKVRPRRSLPGPILIVYKLKKTIKIKTSKPRNRKGNNNQASG